MKKYIAILTFLVFIIITTNLDAQEPLRIGHVNVIKILTALPENDSAQILIEKDTKELELMLEKMQVEYNNLINDYQENKDKYSELVRSTKESEIIEMQNRIETFNQNASQQLQKRNDELMQPIYKRIQLAIDKVASNEGYTYILDVSKGTVVFTGENSSNIDSLVLKELGIHGDY